MLKSRLLDEINKIIKLALKEDDALKDITSDLTIPKDKILKVKISPNRRY